MNIHNLFLTYSVVEQVFDRDRRRPQRTGWYLMAAAIRVMGRPLKVPGIAGFHTLAHATEHDHGQHKADTAHGTDQSLNVGSGKAKGSNVCAK